MSTTAEPCISHRERKKQATRQAIHDAAFDLAEERGLSATTVEAISDRAGVAPRTFWSYFASKEDAVLDRHPGLAEGLRIDLLARPAGEDPASSLRVVLEQFLASRVVDSSRAVRRQQLIRRDPHLMSAVAATFDEIERALIAGVAERMGVNADKDLRPGLVVMAASGACRVAQQHWAQGNGRRSLASVVEEAFALLPAAVAPGSDERSSR